MVVLYLSGGGSVCVQVVVDVKGQLGDCSFGVTGK